MPCPICDQKPMNCDCTPRERAMYRELQELEDRPAVVLTDAEREAVEFAIVHGETVDASWRYALRGLLERMGDCPTPDNAADRDSGTTGHQE